MPIMQYHTRILFLKNAYSNVFNFSIHVCSNFETNKQYTNAGKRLQYLLCQQ